MLHYADHRYKLSSSALILPHLANMALLQQLCCLLGVVVLHSSTLQLWCILNIGHFNKLWDAQRSIVAHAATIVAMDVGDTKTCFFEPPLETQTHFLMHMHLGDVELEAHSVATLTIALIWKPK